MDGVSNMLLVAAMTCAAVQAQTTALSPAMQAEASRVEATWPATPEQRRDAAQRVVTRWSAYVERIYGLDRDAWSRRLAPQFVVADSANIREALRRDTYEGAMAALDGTGHRRSDAQVIDAFADGGAMPDGTPKELGDLEQDLVYNPIVPCRIVDTRVTGPGVIGAGSTRSFRASRLTSFASQGGSASDCGMFNQSPSALAINVTAVAPAGAGYATVYPFNATRPETASVNYVAGAIVNNTVVTPVPVPASASDFSIFTFTASHYVVDLVGYYDAPRATALDCTTTSSTSQGIAAGATASIAAPAAACPLPYVRTSTLCFATGLTLTRVGDGNCEVRNQTTSAQTFAVAVRCCRVPGR